MNDELMKRARELLALRDKATPGPWIYVYLDEWSHSVVTQHGDCPDGEPIYWTVASINKNREPEHEANARLIATAHNMADTIRDLLAEVERLKAAIKRQAAAARQLHSAERALMSADREAAEKARKMTDSNALNGILAANDRLTNEVDLLEKERDMLNVSVEELRRRAEAAESRLRELASAEPVLWYSEKTGVTDDRQHSTYTTALIRRPEMPS